MIARRFVSIALAGGAMAFLLGRAGSHVPTATASRVTPQLAASIPVNPVTQPTPVLAPALQVSIEPTTRPHSPAEEKFNPVAYGGEIRREYERAMAH